MSADATDSEAEAADSEVETSDPDSETDDAETDGEFPAPPRTLTDGEGRVLQFRASGDSPSESATESAPESGDEATADGTDERGALAAMYDAFDASDRAQGIPPADPRQRAQWLDRLRDGIEVVAWHGDVAVGHGILLGGGPGHELALFVHPDYREAGVGTALLRTLLGRGRTAGVERVWLSVERTNLPAVSLYRGVGFEPTGGAVGELEMALSLPSNS
ncbi:GNAT family N-acetyltransferase [Halorussus limi]|uniref:GNAT family N-acetyltransferase n=1 Tax=Halorussus limi TaxID=2938695 RepID=A0A8U0HUW6_9EURY|nr:GNAT family N-acetyltransferase [Halorussus limi]UPV74444.1 GNAT family N-acetyltransferase [Halorussus limi]